MEQKSTGMLIYMDERNEINGATKGTWLRKIIWDGRKNPLAMLLRSLANRRVHLHGNAKVLWENTFIYLFFFARKCKKHWFIIYPPGAP